MWERRYYFHWLIICRTSPDTLIQELKAALKDTYKELYSWREACPDYGKLSLIINWHLLGLRSSHCKKCAKFNENTESTITYVVVMRVVYCFANFHTEEARKRDRSLVMRLSGKEQEIHDLQIQVNDFRQALSPHTRQLVGTLFDPAVNLYQTIGVVYFNFSLWHPLHMYKNCEKILKCWKRS